MKIDHYRTERREWVLGASVYRRAGHGWVINVELFRVVVTIYLGAAQ